MKDPKDRTAKLSLSQITDQEIMIKIKKKKKFLQLLSLGGNFVIQYC